MGVEIERKFLVDGAPWEGLAGTPLVQGYLAREAGVAVRVRLAGARAWLTVKGPSRGATRAEFEVAVPPDEARGMLALCGDRVVEKVRYEVEVAGRTWEVDRFTGRNAGLVVAEVELEAEDAVVELPPWAGREVTDDPRYANAALADRPFDTWLEAR